MKRTKPLLKVWKNTLVMSCGGVAGSPLFSRGNILGLYRDILRASRNMPSTNKTGYIQYKAKREFRKHKDSIDAETILLQIRLAMTQLDAIKSQAQHLTKDEDGASLQKEVDVYWNRGDADKDLFA